MQRARTMARVEGAAAMLAALIAWRWGGRVLWPAGPVVAALVALGTVRLADVRNHDVAASARMIVALLAIEVWNGIGMWVLPVLTVAVAWLDARRQGALARPLVPVGAGLLAAIVWSGVRPGDNVWRAIWTACAAAGAIALASRRSAAQ